MSSINWQLLHKYDTNYSADSVEWCPHYPNLFVCGTYQLNENDSTSNSQKRIGQLLLFSITSDGTTLTCLQRIETVAILDQKWSRNKLNGRTLLAVANAVGELLIYELTETVETPQLQLLAHIEIETEKTDDLLSLSLDLQSDNGLSIVVSDSKGFISLFKFDDKGITKVSRWKGHEFEAWICAFNYWDKSIIYSGGDDCKLKVFDTRIGTTPVSVSSAHEAGVTSMQSNVQKQHVFASGSYDEKILIWDARNFKTPRGSLKASGGVWRIKWDPFKYEQILSACMYGAFHIIDATNQDQLKIIADYHEHSSICYGADWSYLELSNKLERILATCSFYDHLLTISKINING